MFPLSKCAGGFLLAVCVAFVSIVVLVSPEAAWGTWEKGVLDSNGSVGTFVEAQIDNLGDIHVVYLRADTHVLKVVSRISGVWQTPETPDASGQVTADCAIAVDATGARRVSYRRGTTLWYTGPEAVLAWENGVVLSSPDIVGPFLSLQNAPDGELSLSCQNVTQGSLELLMRDAAGVWSSPVVVDPGPGRGSNSDHIYRPGVGYAFSEQSVGGTLLFVDPVFRSDTWEKGVVLSSPDNVGPFLSLQNAPDSELSLSCQNATQGSLVFFTRDGGGAWSSPVTVDPGPGRGSNSDHIYRPGVGYAFSEKSSGHALLFADPAIRTNSWAKGQMYDNGQNGPYVSLERLPRRSAAVCSFFHYDEISLGAVYTTFVHGLSRSTVNVVVDSIATSPSDLAFIDVGVSSRLDFAISYRNTRDPGLYCAIADSSVVVAIGDPWDPATYVMRAQLHQNAPNPFNPSTRIRYEVPVGGGVVAIRIYDVAGRLVKTLRQGPETPGVKTITWDGRNERGEEVASGVYFCRMDAPGFEKTVKVTLVR
jgi:hypothetical protein